jgi:hypothetical protein
MSGNGAGVGVTDRKRSEKALQAERHWYAAESAEGDQAPLWLIALPTVACSVALGSYLLMTVASRLV